MAASASKQTPTATQKPPLVQFDPEFLRIEQADYEAALRASMEAEEAMKLE
jgi:hypothetical protein